MTLNTNVPKSCANCPSFLEPAAAVSKFRKSTGSPMCGRYGHVLGKPGLPKQQADKLHQYFAEKCDSFGEPLPPIPVEKRMQVMLPDPLTRENLPTPQEQEAVRTCAMCVNFVRDDVVAGELGWTAGACAAKGKLILSNQQVYEAKNCEYRKFGPIRQSTAGLHLMPEYEDAFQVNADPVRAYFKNRDNFVDPRDYETNRPVSVEDEAVGIRAWRRVIDPEGTGLEVYLPIYRLDYFSEVEQAKVPVTGDDEHPELYIDHFGGVYTVGVAWTELDETPTLWGGAGAGKTELFRHMAWLMCLPFERVSITGSTELDDLAGKMLFVDNKTTFQYGRVVKAWSKPCVLCVDEPNTGMPDVQQFFRPMFDNSKQLVIDQNNGERMTRHVDCFPGLAMNPAWDPKNVGTAQLSDADINRLFHTYVELPPASLEREIIVNRVKEDGWEMTPEQLDMVMRIAEEIRGLCDEGTLPISWMIRPQIKVARALKWFSPVTAYKRAVADSLEPEAQTALLDVVRAHIEK